MVKKYFSRIDDLVREVLLRALDARDWNQKDTARDLLLSEDAIRRYMRRLNIPTANERGVRAFERSKMPAWRRREAKRA